MVAQSRREWERAFVLDVDRHMWAHFRKWAVQAYTQQKQEVEERQKVRHNNRERVLSAMKIAFGGQEEAIMQPDRRRQPYLGQSTWQRMSHRGGTHCPEKPTMAPYHHRSRCRHDQTHSNGVSKVYRREGRWKKQFSTWSNTGKKSRLCTAFTFPEINTEP